MTKEFNSLKEIEKYYNKETNTYVFKENEEYIDLVVLNFDLNIEADIDAKHIKARNIRAWNIDAWNIDAWNITAYDINACDITAYDIKAHSISAWDISSCDINACDIITRDIKAHNISYYAVCYAYNNIKCKSIKGRRENAKHFVLDGKLEVEKMDKSLEALKRMKENSYYVDDKNLKEDVNILEQALLELKTIKEAEPGKTLEYLDKLEECAYAMKDLPMSNWIDLAENEAELDLKIMDWVENIKFELFKGQQALLELKQIKEAEPSEAMESLERIDKEYATIENEDFKICFNTIKQTLLKAQEQEKILSIILKKRIDLESFYSTFIKDNLSYKYYEKYYGTYGLEKLTKEEFDLLREINNDEK